MEHIPRSIYILWNDMDLPGIQMDIEEAIKRFDQIEKLSFDAWIFNLDAHYIIESHHSYGITIGISCV